MFPKLNAHMPPNLREQKAPNRQRWTPEPPMYARYEWSFAVMVPILRMGWGLPVRPFFLRLFQLGRGLWCSGQKLASPSA